jgi:hypothetical protein
LHVSKRVVNQRALTTRGFILGDYEETWKPKATKKETESEFRRQELVNVTNGLYRFESRTDRRSGAENFTFHSTACSFFLSLSIDLWVISDDDKKFIVEKEASLLSRLVAAQQNVKSPQFDLFTTHSSSRSNFPNSCACSIAFIFNFVFQFVIVLCSLRERLKSSRFSLFPPLPMKVGWRRF